MLETMPGFMMMKIYRNFLKTQNARRDKYGLTQQQLVFILIILENGNSIGLTELTEILEIDKSNTTRTVQSLEKKNYVAKNSIKSKEQKYTISLTEEGLKAAEEIRRSEAESVNNFLSVLEPDEAVLLGKIIEKLISR